MHKSDGLQAIEKPLSSLPLAIGGPIIKHIHKLAHHEPVIGIMGKTGAGKSSLCNELFRGEMSPVSDVNACTRDILRFRLRSGDRSLIIVDLPGVGESGIRDHEYTALYHRILPEMDLVLWVIKADDRALSVDEQFWHRVMKNHRQQVLFVINQADKMAPSHEWDTATGTPSVQQLANLRTKQAAVAAMFKPHHPVCVVSAMSGWGIEEMVETMMCSLPDRATSPLAIQLHGRLCTEPVKKQARDSFSHAVGKVFDGVESSPLLPVPVRAVIRIVRETVVSVARAVWDWIFF
ncbi:TPA: GTPase family protein [Salmonella enterica]|uniref:GTPase family protein n=1 Tax=Salmonella enterica TaxID=28901 RepID=A0A3F3J9G0_SALER|nr:GTPase family protein [Salmonella enterica]EBP3673425.1 GTPase family protein [Salmonella enterica subsp. enterica]EDW0433093.1 GTPase family protein [Salmonella enterica subsp. enterica serovar Lexington]EEJ6652670.1 GTPase family protein [Salmonella enterica subsp. enterica serovar Redlands]EAA7899959.1 GTPase family protein [Salmonella enterica]EAA9127973.1 GTPase family protein [Salmonella enterica]